MYASVLWAVNLVAAKEGTGPDTLATSLTRKPPDLSAAAASSALSALKTIPFLGKHIGFI